MNISSLAKFFSEITGHKIYSINFPTATEGTFIKLEVTSGVEESGGVYDFNIQFMVKAEHPSTSEEVSIDLIEKLGLLTDKEFGAGKYQLILCRASSPQPLFVGIGEDGHYVFSSDFRILASRI